MAAWLAADVPGGDDGVVAVVALALETGLSAMIKVAGIGNKSAQKIVLELRDKVGSYEGSTTSGALREEHDAIEGLIALGYAEREAREALKAVPPEITGTSARIKYALKHLSK